VSRYLLDTNIISNVAKPMPSEALVAWMAGQSDEDLFITSLTVAEIRRGYWRSLPERSVRNWSAGSLAPRARKLCSPAEFFPFDEKAALVWARLMASGTVAGRPRNPLDMIIAAVAEVNDCILVTDNERDFAGLKVVNPMRVG